jgi:hypothetical protein
MKEIKYIIFISSSGSETVINYGSGSTTLLLQTGTKPYLIFCLRRLYNIDKNAALINSCT